MSSLYSCPCPLKRIENVIKQQRKKTVAVFNNNCFYGHLHVTLHCVWEKYKGINILSFQQKCHWNLFMVCVPYKKAPLEKNCSWTQWKQSRCFRHFLINTHTERTQRRNKRQPWSAGHLHKCVTVIVLQNIVESVPNFQKVIRRFFAKQLIFLKTNRHRSEPLSNSFCPFKG